MRPIIYKLFLLITCITAEQLAGAQTCTGSLGSPVFDQTFGQAPTPTTPGAQLPYGITTLTYSPDLCLSGPGSYGIFIFTDGCDRGGWQHLNNDHTGNELGYFMMINGPNFPEVVYTQTVPGNTLCPNTTYQFAAYLMNLYILSDTTGNKVLPNLTFTIQTAAGQVLKTVNTGGIPETVQPTWNEYGTFFTTPSDGSDIVITLTDNIDNQNYMESGNIFAVDDISFTPCGPLISVGFNTVDNTQDQNLCAGDTATYTMVASQQGYINPIYQWQQNLNDGNGWIDVAGATTTTLTKTLDGAPTGTYQYRIGVSGGSSPSPSCRIYSLPLGIYIDPYAEPIPPKTSVCAGLPLQLLANQADTYQWTGPNGFTSNLQSPVITAAAQATDAGRYTVAVSTSGCPSNSSTDVTVYPDIVAVVSNDTTICQGTSAVLSAAQSTGATTISWMPATGLDDANQATVNANPSQTTTYTVTLINACTAISRQVTVTVLPKPFADAGPNKIITQGESVKLNGKVTGDSVTYYWTPPDYLNNPNSLTPIASPVNNITYTLHAQENYNCGADTSSVFIRVYLKVGIPNTFTPNNDGINDYWDITNLGTYPGSTVAVFDRYGEQVYQSINYPKPWDGDYNGKPLPSGTYYYIIDLKNGSPKLSGWVLIVR